MRKEIHFGLPRNFARFVLAALILFTLAAFAQTDDQLADRATAERLTSTLVDLASRYQAATPAEKTTALEKLQQAASQRQQFLSSILPSNPAEVLRVSIPSGVTHSMPKPVQSTMEQEVDLQGELTVAIEDSANSSRLHHFLNTGTEQLELHFAGEAPTHLGTGSIVRVHGVRVQNGLALTSSNTTSTTSTTTNTSTSILPNTFGAQKTLVILVNFQDNTTQPSTVANMQNLVFTTASNFWLENSFQQTWMTGDVAGWYTLPITSTGATCDSTFLSSIQSKAQQAAQNGGFVLGNYSRFVYAFPQISACGWWGYSYIGAMPSNSWINGNFQLQVIDHELGHSLGLYHSHSLSCGSVVYATSGCTQYEYGDYYDIMGNSHPMHYSGFQKERLGWLNNGAQPPITTVGSSGTYQISPYEVQDGTPKALKILQSGSSNTYYYIESRQAIGFDTSLSSTNFGYNNVMNGVLLHVASPGNANGNNLLNMNPSQSLGYAMALDVGQSYTDSTAGITISPTAVSSTGTTVQVTLTGPVCAHTNPTVSMSPSQSQWVTSGTTVSFTLSVTNNDNSSCSSSVFNLGNTVPSGWSSTLGSTFLSLAPGASASATLQVTSPAGTANGFYTVGSSATNSSATTDTASASATYVVATPTISVTTNQSSYSRGQTVSITVTLSSGSSAMSGAAVTVNITKSSGSVVTLTGTTGTNGAMTVSYRLKKTDPVGTYQVRASSSAGGSSATITASTSFGVQ